MFITVVGTLPVYNAPLISSTNHDKLVTGVVRRPTCTQQLSNALEWLNCWYDMGVSRSLEMRGNIFFRINSLPFQWLYSHSNLKLKSNSYIFPSIRITQFATKWKHYRHLYCSIYICHPPIFSERERSLYAIAVPSVCLVCLSSVCL